MKININIKKGQTIKGNSQQAYGSDNPMVKHVGHARILAGSGPYYLSQFFFGL